MINISLCLNHPLTKHNIKIEMHSIFKEIAVPFLFILADLFLH